MTPDVNVLVAASRKDHPHHIPAINWLEKAIDSRPSARPLAILPMVASGFLRLVTHPKVFIEPTPIKSAQSFVHVLLGSPILFVLPACWKISIGFGKLKMRKQPKVSWSLSTDKLTNQT